MSMEKEIKIYNRLKPKLWIERWDKMQERYIARRSERFDVMVQLVSNTQSKVRYILDLGCGTGSLMLKMLKAFTSARVIGIDFDPTLLPLARKRLKSHENRTLVILDDLRKSKWLKQIPKSVDAVVSATALHWMQLEELIKLYSKLAKIIKPGGIFLNADHVGSSNKKIQQTWQKQREQTSNQSTGETW
jgi:cyclopropane fatty-acyl-phospholipid synthase-like methyltransferase